MKHLRRLREGHLRRGGTIVIVAVVTPALLGFSALAMDVGLIYSMDAETQNAVDSAALAGASALSSSGASSAISRAGTYLSPNFQSMTGAPATSVVQVGRWNESTRVFTANDPMMNAVKVTATRNNAPLFFAKVLGWNDYNLTRSAIAELTPRDIALVIDLSASMNDDSELRHYRSYVSDVSGNNRPGVQINLKNIWLALPASKGYNGIGNGSNPAAPGLATANNDQPGTGTGRPQRVVGNPDPGNEPAGGSANPGGPRWGWMTGWGSALTLGSYNPTSDSGLSYIPSGATCSDAEVIANLTEAGYASAERTALLSGANDGTTQNYYNRVKVCLGLAGWRSGKSSAKITTGGSAGDGDGVVSSSELVQNVPWPFGAGSWDGYIQYCCDTSYNGMLDTDSNFQYRYGLKTFVNYLLEQLWNNSQLPELAATPEQPLQSLKDAVQTLAVLLSNLGGADQLSLEVFASTAHHETNLTYNYDTVAGRLAALQSNHYDYATNIGAGLRAAVNELTSVRARSNSKKVIILLTDGKPDADSSNTFRGYNCSSCATYATSGAQLAADNNITIYTIAVGADPDRSITQSIASLAGGQEFFAGSTPDTYTPALQSILQDIGGRQVVSLVK